MVRGGEAHGGFPLFYLTGTSQEVQRGFYGAGGEGEVLSAGCWVLSAQSMVLGAEEGA